MQRMKNNISKILLTVLVISSIVSCQSQQVAKEFEELKSQTDAYNQKLEQNKLIVRRTHEEVWSKGNTAVIDDLYAPDYIAHWITGGDTGLDEFKKMITETRTTFPDQSEKITHIVAENDLVVTYFISSGTFLGPLNGIPPNGNKYSRPEIAVHRIENGKIIEQWTVADLMSILNQLEISL